MKREAAGSTLRSIKITGDAPPSNLVGYSTTIVQDSLYIFGGRLDSLPAHSTSPPSSTPALSSSLYRLNLVANHWIKLWPPRGEQSVDSFHSQLARSEHSVNVVHGSLVISGGRSDSLELAPVAIWEYEDEEWIIPPPPSAPPRQRYDHLSIVVHEGAEGETLWLMGGLDDSGNEIATVDRFDLESMEWVEGHQQGCGMHSLSSATSSVASRGMLADSRDDLDTTDSIVLYASTYSDARLISLDPSTPSASQDDIIHTLGLPTLARPHISFIGHFLVLFGFCATTAQLWILDIDRHHDGYEVEWTFISLPSAGKGSCGGWLNGAMWENQFVLFRRDFESIATVSLSPFGVITRPSVPTPTPESLVMLQLFRDSSLVDFSFVCVEGIVKARKLILASRWEWFRNEVYKSQAAELSLPISCTALSLLIEYFYTNAFPLSTSGSAVLELLLFTQSPSRPKNLHSWLVYALFEALRNGLVSPQRKQVEVAIFESTLTTGEATLMARAVKVMMEQAPLLRADRRRPDSCSSILDSFPRPSLYSSPPTTNSTDSTMPFGTPWESSPHAYAAILPVTPPITPEIRTILSPIDAWNEEGEEESDDYRKYLNSTSSSSTGSPVVSYLPSLPPLRLAPLPPLPPAPLASSPISIASDPSFTPTTRTFAKGKKKSPNPIKAKPVLVSMYDIAPPAKPFVSAAFPAVYAGYYGAPKDEAQSVPIPPKNEFMSPSPKKPSRLVKMLRSRSAPVGPHHDELDLTSSLNSFPPLLEVTTHSSSSGTSYFDDRISYPTPRHRATSTSPSTLANSSAGHPAAFLSAFKMRGHQPALAKEQMDESAVEMLHKGDYFDSLRL